MTRILVLAFCTLLACGAKSELRGSDAQGSATQASTTAGTSGGGHDGGAGGYGAGGSDAGTADPQCLCPDLPGYAECVKPEECCPVVGRCKNPSNFNCTGSTLSCSDFEPQ